MAENATTASETEKTILTDEYLQTISGNIMSLLSDTPLSMDLIRLPSGGEPIRASTSPAIQHLCLMTEVRKLVEESQIPASVTKSHFDNRQQVETGQIPIRPESYIHGMKLEYAHYLKYGLLSGDFYRGKVMYEDPLALYITKITSDKNKLSTLNPKDIIEGTMSKWFMGSGSILLVLSDKPDFRQRFPEIDTPADELNHYGKPIPISVGVSATNLTAAITYTPEDNSRAINILGNFPFYIPLYDGVGKLQFPFPSWLNSHKK